MTVLILDPLFPEYHPIYGRQKDRAIGFSEIAQRHASWQIDRIPFFLGEEDPKHWLSNLYAALERAEILICLGDYTIMRQTADLKIAGQLKTKAEQGCPILLQIPGMRYRMNHNLVPTGMEDVLRKFGVNPLDIKVGSDLLATDDHQSPYVCKFTTEDNCFLDPDLFRGIRELERIPVTWKRSLHVGSNWCILAG